MNPPYAECHGKAGEGEPLVLIHGFGGGAFQWRDLAKRFSRSRPVLAYDLPGHGRSVDADGIGGAGRMAKALLADAERRGLQKIHLAGHSLGGAAAAIMALRSPGRVASLTLLAPGGFGPESNHAILKRYAHAADPGSLRGALKEMFGRGGPIPEMFVSETLRRRDPRAVRAMDDILAAILVEDEKGDMRQGTIPHAQIRSLAMPASVAWGSLDRVLPVRQAEGFPAGFETLVLEGAGHMLIEECGIEAGDLIARTIARAAAQL